MTFNYLNMAAKTKSAENLMNRLGMITDNRIIINDGKYSNVIYLEEIQRINLVKKRRFYGNLYLMLAAVTISTLLLYVQWGPIVETGIGLVIFVAGMMAVFYKFYFYLIIIHLKDKQTLTIKNTQLHREQVKKFYYSIRKKLRKIKMPD